MSHTLKAQSRKDAHSVRKLRREDWLVRKARKAARAASGSDIASVRRLGRDGELQWR